MKFYPHRFTLLFCLLVIIFVPITYAQSNPPFGGIFTCPGNPACPSSGPSQSVISGMPPNPTNSVSEPPTNQNPSMGPSNPEPNTPCTTASLAGADSKHWEPNGGISGFMEELIRFFIELINMILKLIGGTPLEIPNEGNPLPLPSQAPQVPNEPDPNHPNNPNNPQNPNPDPCAPTNPNNPVPPTGGVQPSVPAVSTPPGPSAAPIAGVLSRNGKTLMLNGQPYKFTGFNAFGLEGCEGLSYSASDLNAYFSSLKPYSMTRTGAFQPWGLEPLDAIVQSAEANNQLLILMLADGRSQCNENDGATGGDGSGKSLAWYQSGFRTTYLPWVRQVVERYKNSKAIGMWELLNEPGFDAPDNVMKAFFDETAGVIKSIDPSHLVETGTIAEYVEGSTDFALVHGGPNIDVASLHEYDYDYQDSNVIESGHFQPAIEAMNSINKPLIIGEVGINGAASGCRTSYAQRSAAFKQKFDTYFSKGAAGILIWNWSKGDYSNECSWWVGPNDPLLEMMRTYQ